MIHARLDYNRIQDPAVQNPGLLAKGCTAIGEDEPVFLLRGKDKLAPALIREWAERLKMNGGSITTASYVEEFADQMEEWQKKNGCKLPDTPMSELIA